MATYRDGVKRNGDKIDYGPPHYYAHTNYVTIIVPSQSCLLFFLHHPYTWPLSICKIFNLLVTKHGSALYIGMAKVLPIIDVLGYDGQNSSFSSSPSSSRSDSTPITQKRSHIST